MICDLNCSQIVDPGDGAITLMGDYKGRSFRIKIMDGLWHQLEGDLNRQEAEDIIDFSTKKIFRFDLDNVE